KIDSRYAINSTLFHPMTLDRGTPVPTDDVLVQSGQAWVTVTSPTEGTSRVTVFAPQVYGWDRRQQTASIYWVDAQWRFPPPACHWFWVHIANLDFHVIIDSRPRSASGGRWNDSDLSASSYEPGRYRCPRCRGGRSGPAWACVRQQQSGIRAGLGRPTMAFG